LGEQAPATTFEVTAPLTIAATRGKDQNRIFLGRIWRGCTEAPRDCETALRDFVQKTVVVFGAQAAKTNATRGQIFAALRPKSYLEAAGPLPPFAHPFVGDLCVVYMVDTPAFARPIFDDEAKALGLTAATLDELAMKNLADKLGVDAVASADRNGVMVFATGNYYESSRLLLRDGWVALAARTHAPIYVAIPENNVLLVAVDADQERRTAVEQVAKDGYAHAQLPISERLFRWTDRGWETVGGK
jgi:uncharacterized protein YtpQ (UPF0354 family)